MGYIRQISRITFLPVVFFLFIQCQNAQKEKKQTDGKEDQYSYLVKKCDQFPEINAQWDKEVWKSTQAIRLENYMGEKPSHFPETQVKLRYDEANIYLIFNVADQYVKAVEKKNNGKVWLDSCVEFFFTPGSTIDRGYFNLEANCKGVFLFEYHIGDNKAFVREEDLEKINISHSLKRNVEQEIDEKLEWQVEYSIPFSVLNKYMEVDQPGKGVSWRANFYKCADQTSHPHWLTWAFVDFPKPRFHLPAFFGRLDFE